MNIALVKLNITPGSLNITPVNLNITLSRLVKIILWVACLWSAVNGGNGDTIQVLKSLQSAFYPCSAICDLHSTWPMRNVEPGSLLHLCDCNWAFRQADEITLEKKTTHDSHTMSYILYTHSNTNDKTVWVLCIDLILGWCWAKLQIQGHF